MFWLNPSLLRCYSVRPIFLGCCVLVVKVSREGAAPSLSNLLSRVQDVFNLLDVTLLSRIEHQLLEVLSSQPAPIAPQPRPRISLPHSLCAPMRCRCWTGGCPRTPGNIKSTPTRSSARQWTRSSRRPCRTRARRGKLEFLCVLRVAPGRARGSARLERDRLSTMSGGKAPHFARRRFAVWIHWSASN